MRKILILVICSLLLPVFLSAQSSDTQYQQPLKEVLDMIQERYGVKIKYNEDQVRDKVLNYAVWRFRTDVDETLSNVLAPLDMKVNKEGEGKYKLKDYEYHRWEEEDGWDYLDYLASQYHDRISWELRKDSLRIELFEALKLAPMPAKPMSKVRLTVKRKFEGYTVENFALEILPGLFVNGSIYRPAKAKGKMPVILSPDGHWGGHRYRRDAQIRCAMLAKMGAVAVSYDLFAWGESLLQFRSEDHRRSLALTVQTLGGIRILDYILTDKYIDPLRVGICGGSGGGNHTTLLTALDDRITLSIPVVSLSSYHFGGCPCESGFPIHACGGGTNNVELAAIAAPRPQLVISDGKDWTAHAPEHDFPYLQKMYAYYGASDNIENVHLPNDGHDFGYSKRKPVYDFLVKHFGLNRKGLMQDNGEYDESACTVEEQSELYAFGKNGENIPDHAIYGFENLEKLFQ